MGALFSAISRRLAASVLGTLAVLLILVPAALAASPGAATDTLDITDDLGSWAALVGIALPALVALLQRTHWTSVTNALVFAAAVVIASVVYGFVRFGGDFSWAHWQGTLLAIVVWGIATYRLYWKPSQIADKLRAVPLGILPDTPTKKGKG